MSRYKRGTPNHSRTRARNFTQVQAQARLDEAVAAANTQYINALFVNGVEAELYQTVLSDRPCTCEKTEILPEFAQMDGTEGPILDNPLGNEQDIGVKINLQENFFGEPAEQHYGDEIIDILDLAEQMESGSKTGYESVDHTDMVLAGTNIKCGICYKQGSQPGFNAYGKQRRLLTTYDVKDIDGFFIDRSQAPHVFIREHKKGFVEFITLIPKYYTSLTYSVRNNMEVLIDTVLINGLPISKDVLNANKGKEVTVRISASEFTHCTFEFNNSHATIKMNISDEVISLDYSRLIAIGSFSVVLPPSIPTLNNEDIVIIRKRGLALKLSEVKPRQTQDRRIMGWEAQARVLQPNEELRRIHSGHKILNK